MEEVKVRTEADIQGEYTQACMQYGDLAFKARVHKENFDQGAQILNQKMDNLIKVKKKLGEELQAIKGSSEVKPNEAN